MSLSQDLKVIASPMYLHGLVQRTVMTDLTIFNLHCRFLQREACPIASNALKHDCQRSSFLLYSISMDDTNWLDGINEVKKVNQISFKTRYFEWMNNSGWYCIILWSPAFIGFRPSTVKARQCLHHLWLLKHMTCKSQHSIEWTHPFKMSTSKWMAYKMENHTFFTTIFGEAWLEILSKYYSKKYPVMIFQSVKLVWPSHQVWHVWSYHLALVPCVWHLYLKNTSRTPNR